jgi:hypothetical protein
MISRKICRREHHRVGPTHGEPRICCNHWGKPPVIRQLKYRSWRVPAAQWHPPRSTPQGCASKALAYAAVQDAKQCSGSSIPMPKPKAFHRPNAAPKVQQRAQVHAASMRRLIACLRAALEVHHITPRSKLGRDAEGNLITPPCWGCHRQIDLRCGLCGI